MSTDELQGLLRRLQAQPRPQAEEVSTLLAKAKRELLQLDALLPTTQTPPAILNLARTTLETGALLSIQHQLPDVFIRYYQQLGPFYELPASAYASEDNGDRCKIVALYLLLLLTKGDYAEFHTVLEALELEAERTGNASLETDAFIGYPVKLERWLMEGSYDKVWQAVGKERMPSTEFGIFNEILIGTIRSEIASCSAKSYSFLPIPNAKNLLFLDSEGAVFDFARTRDWPVKDGRIWFPQQDALAPQDDRLASEQTIENAIGYTRELEMIV